MIGVRDVVGLGRTSDICTPGSNVHSQRPDIAYLTPGNLTSIAPVHHVRQALGHTASGVAIYMYRLRTKRL
jgi:hypothetical protein